jgi:hypothetical protein
VQVSGVVLKRLFAFQKNQCCGHPVLDSGGSSPSSLNGLAFAAFSKISRPGQSVKASRPLF